MLEEAEESDELDLAEPCIEIDPCETIDGIVCEQVSTNGVLVFFLKIYILHIFNLVHPPRKSKYSRFLCANLMMRNPTLSGNCLNGKQQTFLFQKI